MTKTKYIEFGNRGFWAYDVALGVFLKHLIDAAEKSGQAKRAWLSTAISSWREVACISDYGLKLESGWSAAKRQAFIALAEVACARLAERASIPAGEVGWPILNDLSIHTRGAVEMHTAPVVELGRAIIELVSGELPKAHDGEFWFYGTPTGRKTLGRRSSD
jgi:hypothetical protein